MHLLINNISEISLESVLIQPISFSLNTDCLQQLVTGFTKPGEVGEILALYQLKSPSLDCKAKLKAIKVALFLFASHSFLANNLRFMVN
jgi:hypothetical protein